MSELARVESKRPYRKYTPQEIIDALEVSRGLIAPAARNLGCSRDTIRKYLAEYPEVAKAKADMREAVTDMAENSLYEAIRRGEAWAVCFYLKCMARDRGYIEKAEIARANSSTMSSMSSSAAGPSSSGVRPPRRGWGVPKKPRPPRVVARPPRCFYTNPISSPKR